MNSIAIPPGTAANSQGSSLQMIDEKNIIRVDAKTAHAGFQYAEAFLRATAFIQ